jgi:hypothetical protein
MVELQAAVVAQKQGRFVNGRGSDFNPRVDRLKIRPFSAGELSKAV